MHKSNVTMISIHALTRSATRNLLNLQVLLVISIHALTRSATYAGADNILLLGRNFNPRTHKECDFTGLRMKDIPLVFQSTHSQGVRRLSNLIFADMALISIHALTRSAT